MDKAIKKVQDWVLGHYGDRDYYYTLISQKGKQFLCKVDIRDLDEVSKYRWHLTDSGYAISWINGKRLKMHHLIMGKPEKGKEVDHINRSRLDNRRSNLRFATRLQNGSNTKGDGVRQRGKTWEGNVCVNYRKHFKGGFKTRKEAQEWRDGIKRRYEKTIWT